MKTTVKTLKAREILDSRGNPTIEVDATLAGGSFGRAAVPSGASTGAHEAVELRDEEKGRYRGKGTRRAAGNVNEIIAPALAGLDGADQGEIDRRMIALDGTPNKGRLGANAILGASLAISRAVASAMDVPYHAYLGRLFADHTGVPSEPCLPVPMMNILNGGKHATNNVDFQEFMVMPWGVGSFREALRAGSEIFWALKDILKGRKQSTGVGDEGGFAPDLGSNKEAIELLVEAIKQAGYEPGRQVSVALDPAASSFYDEKKRVYRLKSENVEYDTSAMVRFWEGWTAEYPIRSLEDGLAEDDWAGWKDLTARLGSRVQIVGDDIFVTDKTRVERGVRERAASAVLIKVNQIGTLTETLETMAVAKKAGLGIVISHRSGETEDTTIADLAVGTGAGQIKSGAPSRGERVAKYNQLLRLEEELGPNVRFGNV